MNQHKQEYLVVHWRGHTAYRFAINTDKNLSWKTGVDITAYKFVINQHENIWWKVNVDITA